MLLLPFLGAALAVPALADLDVTLSAEIRLGKVLPPPPPEVVVIAEPVEKGPPPWAPAHGFRRNRDYYYYPGANVYFRPSDRAWFYLDGGDWRIAVALPTGIRVNFTESVSLTMETERPYEYHAQVREHYPRDYFGKKVRIKEKAAKPAKVKAEPAPDTDHADRGQGGGKGKGRNKD
jgi:hypothetical protein